MKDIIKNKFIVIGGTIILIIVLLVLLAPILTHYDYGAIDLKSKQVAPCAEHILGTDVYGRDVWTRLLYGGRISLTVAVFATIVALIIGTLLGSLAGYIRGGFDFILSRINDIFMAFPMLLLALIIGIALGSSLITMIFAIGIPCIPMFFRIARSTTMAISERNYVAAAKSMGSRRITIILRHIIPNVMPHILVIFSSCMGGAILAESSLGFLGFGIPQPTPSWGLVVNEGKEFMFSYPWTTTFAGLFIALTIFGFNLLGDGLRDHLDPKLRNSRV